MVKVLTRSVIFSACGIGGGERGLRWPCRRSTSRRSAPCRTATSANRSSISSGSISTPTLRRDDARLALADHEPGVLGLAADRRASPAPAPRASARRPPAAPARRPRPPSRGPAANSRGGATTRWPAEDEGDRAGHRRACRTARAPRATRGVGDLGLLRPRSAASASRRAGTGARAGPGCAPRRRRPGRPCRRRGRRDRPGSRGRPPPAAARCPLLSSSSAACISDWSTATSRGGRRRR